MSHQLLFFIKSNSHSRRDFVEIQQIFLRKMIKNFIHKKRFMKDKTFLVAQVMKRDKENVSFLLLHEKECDVKENFIF